MMKLAIDGSLAMGTYRVDCECGDTWHGQAENIGRLEWSPALPIAECVVHMKLVHPELGLDIRFSERFRQWLVRYWDQTNLRLLANHGHESALTAHKR